jgi:DNA-binding IclR family transcriptional regulator
MRDPRTRTYSMGPRFVSLSVAAVGRFGLAGVAHGALRELRDRTGETVSVHLRVGEARICIDGAESPHGIRRALSVGESVPIFAGPTGKAILAFLPQDALTKAIGAAEAAGHDVAHIRGQMAVLRHKHYLVVTSDRTPGVGAVSTPLFGASGVVASLTVAGPEDRWTIAEMERVAPEVLRVATDISRALGGAHPAAARESHPLTEGTPTWAP